MYWYETDGDYRFVFIELLVPAMPAAMFEQQRKQKSSNQSNCLRLVVLVPVRDGTSYLLIQRKLMIGGCDKYRFAATTEVNSGVTHIVTLCVPIRSG